MILKNKNSSSKLVSHTSFVLNIISVMIKEDIARDSEIALLLTLAKPNGTKYNSPATRDMLVTSAVIAINVNPGSDSPKK
ncbi:hypothetical protein C1141_20855 [Vibrio agarivorans]|nr:hypothetical protein C1141_20855 [Vibrio agarivorans]